MEETTFTLYLPRLGTTSVRVTHFEVGRILEKCCSLWVSLTLNREAIVEVLPLLKESKERHPCILSFLAVHEGIHVADHYDTTAGSGDQYIEPLRRGHEADVTVVVASSERCNDYVAFLPLVVIYDLVLTQMQPAGRLLRKATHQL